MSIDECGFPCIGLGSVSNIGKIFNYNSNYDILTDEYNQIYNIIGPFTQYDEINEREKKYYTIKPDENNKIKSIILAKK